MSPRPIVIENVHIDPAKGGRIEVTEDSVVIENVDLTHGGKIVVG